MYKLEVAFIQGSSPISKMISKVSKALTKKDYSGSFCPSHVFLVMNDKIIFESSTYKNAGTNDEKVLEKGTRILNVVDRASKVKNNLIARTVICNDLDPYLALKFVAKASNYKYSYSSIFKFLFNGRFTRQKKKEHTEYICSGLVIDALREEYFKDNKSIQKVLKMFEGLDSNSITPLDLFLAFCKAGYNFRTCKGLLEDVSNL